MEFVAHFGAFSPRLSQRGVSLGLVLLLHLLLIAILLTQTFDKGAFVKGERETVLPLTPLSRAPPARATPRAVRRATTPRAITLPPALRLPSAPDIAALGRMLSDCAPENLATLPAEERAKCHMALGGPSGNGWTAYKRLASHSRYRAMWEAALADEHSPLRVACTTAKQIKAPPGTPDRQQATAVIVDPVCLVAKILQALQR